MQIIIATSRSINQDKFYQAQQHKQYQIHASKLESLKVSKPEPPKLELTYQKNLRKAKSAAKLFQKSVQTNQLRYENRLLLNKLINVQPTIKTMTLKFSSKDKNVTSMTASNWLSRKKEEDKTLRKQNELMQKRFESLSNTNAKQFRKKIQEQIKQYLELKNKIRKMKPVKSESGSKSTRRSSSQRKIKPELPLPQIIKAQAKISDNNKTQPVKTTDQNSIQNNQLISTEKQNTLLPQKTEKN